MGRSQPSGLNTYGRFALVRFSRATSAALADTFRRSVSHCHRLATTVSRQPLQRALPNGNPDFEKNGGLHASCGT